MKINKRGGDSQRNEKAEDRDKRWETNREAREEGRREDKKEKDGRGEERTEQGGKFSSL